MSDILAVLGAGPHGRQIAHDFDGETLLFDDELPGYRPTIIGARLRPWLVGAAWPDVRRNIVARIRSSRNRLTLAPHDNGLYVAPTAVIGIDVTAGEHAHILANATVSHGCILGDYVTVATGATLCGEVKVGAGAFIGAGAVVIHGGIRIGANAKVAAGAVVVVDVPDGVTVLGNPARPK